MMGPEMVPPGLRNSLLYGARTIARPDSSFSTRNFEILAKGNFSRVKRSSSSIEINDIPVYNPGS